MFFFCVLSSLAKITPVVSINYTMRLENNLIICVSFSMMRYSWGTFAPFTIDFLYEMNDYLSPYRPHPQHGSVSSTRYGGYGNIKTSYKHHRKPQVYANNLMPTGDYGATHLELPSIAPSRYAAFAQTRPIHSYIAPNTLNGDPTQPYAKQPEYEYELPPSIANGGSSTTFTSPSIYDGPSSSYGGYGGQSFDTQETLSTDFSKAPFESHQVKPGFHDTPEIPIHSVDGPPNPNDRYRDFEVPSAQAYHSTPQAAHNAYDGLEVQFAQQHESVSIPSVAYDIHPDELQSLDNREPLPGERYGDLLNAIPDYGIEEIPPPSFDEIQYDLRSGNNNALWRPSLQNDVAEPFTNKRISSTDGNDGRKEAFNGASFQTRIEEHSNNTGASHSGSSELLNSNFIPMLTQNGVGPNNNNEN